MIRQENIFNSKSNRTLSYQFIWPAIRLRVLHFKVEWINFSRVQKTTIENYFKTLSIFFHVSFKFLLKSCRWLQIFNHAIYRVWVCTSVKGKTYIGQKNILSASWVQRNNVPNASPNLVGTVITCHMNFSSSIALIRSRGELNHRRLTVISSAVKSKDPTDSIHFASNFQTVFKCYRCMRFVFVSRLCLAAICCRCYALLCNK